MAPNKKYLSLEEAAEQLGMQPDELVRQREKGEIRGFADRGTWKFKADEVEEFHRRRQIDSDPDLPLLDLDEEKPKPSKPPVARGGMNSDSDVRLAVADDTKRKALSGSSAEVQALDFDKSDSDIRLVEAPPSKHLDSDSDVKIIKPVKKSKVDSDSDVKMVSPSGRDDDSDSDVKYIDPKQNILDSDSDVRMAQSDSDVKLADMHSDSDVYVDKSDSDIRLAPSLQSDSDVRIISKKPNVDDDSDSDVMLLGGKQGKGSGGGLTSPDRAPLADSGISLAGDSDIKLSAGSGAKLADSGIRLADDSGIRLQDDDSGIKIKKDSGLRLGGDSGIRLDIDSGISLSSPTDSGISLEGKDSGVRFADSGITLGDDSGFNLASPSSGNLGKKKPGSGRRVKGGGRTEDDIESTLPMRLPDQGEDDSLDPFAKTIGEVEALDFDEFDAGDTSEMASMTDSGQNVVMFEDDEEEARGKKKGKKKQPAESLFAMDDTDGAELEELEVSDEDLSGEEDYGDLSFADDESELSDSFTEGSSQFDMTVPRKTQFVAQEVEWSGGFFSLLLASLCLSIFSAIVSADLLRNVFASSQESVSTPGFMSLLGSLWK